MSTETSVSDGRGCVGRVARRVLGTHLRQLGCAALVASWACTEAGVPRGDSATPSSTEPALELDVPYEPSPPIVVERMLELGEVSAQDVVFDLGCGDGRIVIAAAKRGARGVCVDLDPDRIREARDNAQRAGVQGQIEFRVGDLFDADLQAATVVMLFLWPEVNLRLRPKLQADLRPGARVVSHYHDMGDWEPERVIVVSARGRARSIYLWRLPSSAPR